MLLIPAIDLKDGQCVRLQQGDMDKVTIFGSPVDIAASWIKKGARALHLVDLNGAFAGISQNKAAILEILQMLKEQYSDIPVQLGGGIRDLKAIEYWLDAGISSVIIGTAAIKNPIFFKQACDLFMGHIILGLDAKDGMIATDGWAKVSEHNVVDTAQSFEDYGLNNIIYTDIGRDGMLKGINIEATVDLAKNINTPVVASGGLANINDIEKLCSVAEYGVSGVICGRAIYTGDLDFASAQILADKLTDNLTAN
jgi:phosphoribosylformimino-5-aminoimidazole carboxamide ribotide isomerase